LYEKATVCQTVDHAERPPDDDQPQTFDPLEKISENSLRFRK
jgi:hypothetical protein